MSPEPRTAHSFMREGYKLLRREVPVLPKHVLELLPRDDRVPTPTLLTFVQVYAGIAETGVFIPLELVNGIVHKGIVAPPKENEQIKILIGSSKAPNFFGQSLSVLGVVIFYKCIPTAC